MLVDDAAAFRIRERNVGNVQHDRRSPPLPARRRFHQRVAGAVMLAAAARLG